MTSYYVEFGAVMLSALAYVGWKSVSLRRVGVPWLLLIGMLVSGVLVTALLDLALPDSGWIGFVQSWILTPIVLIGVAWVAMYLDHVRSSNRSNSAE